MIFLITWTACRRSLVWWMCSRLQTLSPPPALRVPSTASPSDSRTRCSATVSMSAGDDVSARPQSKRLWLGGGAVVAVVIVLIGWFGVIGPELSAAAATRDQADSARMQNVTLQAKNTKLKAQNDDVATLRASLANALAALPSDGGLPEFTRQISAQATSTSVVLTSIVVAAAA